MQARLAQLTSLSGSAPLFDAEHAPAEPGPLFEQWFEEAAAAAAGIKEPHDSSPS